MSGVPAFNFPAFETAAGALRAAALCVISPHEMHAGRVDLPYETYLRAGVEAAVASAGVVLLPGWAGSAGARAEVRAARAAGVPLYHYEDVRRAGCVPPSSTL
jgi:hypothetical protein